MPQYANFKKEGYRAAGFYINEGTKRVAILSGYNIVIDDDTKDYVIHILWKKNK